MDSDNHFSLISFTDTTKKVCMCSTASIFIIVLFIITPLSNFFKTSMFMKLIALILLIYTIYLNNQQTNQLRKANQVASEPQVKSQLNMNILCSYVFTLFIGLLVIFVIKSFF